MKKDIKKYIPKHKLDNFYVEELLLLEDQEIEEIFFDLIKWIKDMSYPISKELLPVLIKNVKSLHVVAIKILDDEKEDSILKYNIISYILEELTLDQLKEYEKPLTRIAFKPLKYEKFYEADIAAKKLLKKMEK